MNWTLVPVVIFYDVPQLTLLTLGVSNFGPVPALVVFNTCKCVLTHHQLEAAANRTQSSDKMVDF